MSGSITDVPGIIVGQAQDFSALTGCTVILCETGATAGVDQRGGAPGTRETDLLKPMHWVNQVHAVVLSGGSAFGLDASSGVMKYLEEKGIGLDTGYSKVPIVPSAVLFDLGIGRPDIRPDAKMGYEACINSSSQPPLQGNYGAGTGATLGKIMGMDWAMKSGIGTASIKFENGLVIGAIFAPNPIGDIIDLKTNRILAGARNPHPGGDPYVDTMKLLYKGQHIAAMANPNNTVIGVVATNAKLSKEEVNKVAQMAHSGLARVITPAHTMMDGDTIFCLATNEIDTDINIVGAYAAHVTSDAIVNGVLHADEAANCPAVSSKES